MGAVWFKSYFAPGELAIAEAKNFSPFTVLLAITSIGSLMFVPIRIFFLKSIFVRE